MLRRPIFGALCLLSLFAAGTAAGRTWHDAKGEYEVEAQFLTAQFGKFWLLRADGRIFGVEPSELSEADQEYVRHEIARRKAALRPTSNPPGRIAYGPGRTVCLLEDERIDESSGIASSLSYPDCFWTHNDSGGGANLFLIRRDGTTAGVLALADTMNYDFEDICSARVDGKSYVIVGDVGNNGRAAAIQMLHVIREPEWDLSHSNDETAVPVAQTIYYSYEDDHRDCEAFAFDPESQTFLFVTREKQRPCFVYSLPWPPANPNKAFSAKRIASLNLPPVTAMDIAWDGRRAVVLTYGNAYEFVRGKDETWSAAFQQEPREIVVPERIQGESICYGRDGKTLYLTSERRPTPLIEIPVIDRSSDP